MTQNHDSEENLIIHSLPEEERYRLIRRMSRVELPIRHPLLRSGEAPTGVYFLLEGLGSVVTRMNDGSAVETLMIGREGCVGMAAFLEVSAPLWDANQQVAGSALRLSAADLRKETSKPSVLREALLRFTGFMLAQTMQSAACNRLHDAPSRCARWLLDVRERIGRDSFSITQEFVGEMLGASRSSVSTILGRFEEEGLLEHTRGSICIVSPAAFEQHACECRVAIAREYARYLDALRAMAKRQTG